MHQQETLAVFGAYQLVRILLDITRTIIRSARSTPTGIDRVEYAFLDRILKSDVYPDVHFVANTLFGPVSVNRRRVDLLYRQISGRWIKDHNPSSASDALPLRKALEDPIDPSRTASLRFGSLPKAHHDVLSHVELSWLGLTGFGSLASLSRDAARMPTYYYHVSHAALDNRRAFQWLAASKVTPIFFLHDLIPIDYPEFCRPGSNDKHVKRLDTMLRYARSIIVNSGYTRDRLASYARGLDVVCPPIIVSRLGADLQEMTLPPMAVSGKPVPYFVHIGTIEGRKNILHLFNVWRRLLGSLGPADMPRLVLVGRRGWESENVADVLDRSRELAPYLVEIADVSDGRLVTLIKGAAGVLAPSLVEGYSLPPAEALGLGIPVIASDIAVHREILGDAAVILDPTDGPAWARSIMRLVSDADYRQDRLRATMLHVPNRWDTHVEQAIAASMAAARDTLAPPASHHGQGRNISARTH